MPGRRTQYTPKGGSGGGPGGTGNLRWGPQFGDNEKVTFGPIGSISLADARQIVQEELISQQQLVLIGQIAAHFDLTAEEAISIFFTLVFLYTEIVEASITMPSIQEVGLLMEQSAITHALAAKYDLTVQAALSVFFTLTFLYQLFVEASITMPALQEIGLLLVQTIITGKYDILYNLASPEFIRVTALVLSGALQSQAAFSLSMLQIGSLQEVVVGTLSYAINTKYDMTVRSAITMPALQEAGVLQASGTMTGQLVIDYLRVLLAEGPGTGMAARYDANAITGLNDGDPLTTWIDTSGTGNDVAQSSAGAKPTYHMQWRAGRPVVTFDGGDALNKGSVGLSGTSGSVFAVLNIDTDAGVKAVLTSADQGSTTRAMQCLISSVSGSTNRIQVSQRNNDTTDLVYGDTSILPGEWVICEWHSDGAAYELRVDGVIQSLTVLLGANNGDWFGDTTLRDNLLVGGLLNSGGSTNLFNGGIAEIIAFDGVTLSAQDKADWRSYLARKWSIVGLAASGGIDPIANIGVAKVGVGSLQETVAGAVKMPAAALSGLAQASARIELEALVELGLIRGAGSLGLTYVVTYNAAGSFTFTTPAGVTSIKAEVWAGGGGGGQFNSGHGGGGGGGGAYSREDAFASTPGTGYTVTIGAGGIAPVGDGADSWFNSTATVFAEAGQGGANGAVVGQGNGGPGGASGSGVGDTKFSGGNGGGGGGAAALNGGGGGGGAGNAAVGGAGNSNGTKGTGGADLGGNGGAGGTSGNPATQPLVYSGGGGGGASLGAPSNGARGGCILTMTPA